MTLVLLLNRARELLGPDCITEALTKTPPLRVPEEAIRFECRVDGGDICEIEDDTWGISSMSLCGEYTGSSVFISK